ncbi:hypothetical protein BKA56DRAFT_608822 [Ilyonectria sp. MPI-CAGE-AT-0026]|nr:hypothetical protein BKA56DRAFT_608822 [Ilyonectria sp. MPI-CAGE-AT-0026]
MKTAERLEAGWLQGGAVGAGIGAGIASGIGITVDSLITGIVAIPTSGFGMLIGAGTGPVRGHWVKYTDSFSIHEADTIKKEAQQEANKDRQLDLSNLLVIHRGYSDGKLDFKSPPGAFLGYLE